MRFSTKVQKSILFFFLTTIISSANATSSFNYVLTPGSTDDHNLICTPSLPDPDPNTTTPGTGVDLKEQDDLDQHLTLVKSTGATIKLFVGATWDFYDFGNGFKVVDIILLMKPFCQERHVPTRCLIVLLYVFIHSSFYLQQGIRG
jgi:hypothetical protein